MRLTERSIATPVQPPALLWPVEWLRAGRRSLHWTTARRTEFFATQLGAALRAEGRSNGLHRFPTGAAELCPRREVGSALGAFDGLGGRGHLDAFSQVLLAQFFFDLLDR